MVIEVYSESLYHMQTSDRDTCGGTAANGRLFAAPTPKLQLRFHARIRCIQKGWRNRDFPTYQDCSCTISAFEAVTGPAKNYQD